ncbi:hypothetical protein F6X40_17060 [Paraburkholderia sp. UCT31]|uniref:hypothetical protein n=1 Tax=Paraburkholderia sp. UCT31 TaxID=2615209 RepID=UPI001654F200|nr:hypothetical protein [Paraburkholderia sp. UCT31]MBC8738485.1 hypothetical protein [Paraburkholderia sp. UCT31]
MFSLLVTVISIALVVVLAAATMYYGGGVISNSGAAGNASKVLNESTQITGAIQSYQNDNAGSLPASMSDLITGGYLASAPSQSWSFSTDAVIAQQMALGSCNKTNADLGYNLSAPPSCSDPAWQNVTVCCQ